MDKTHQKIPLSEAIAGMYSVKLLNGVTTIELAHHEQAHTKEELVSLHPDLYRIVQHLTQTDKHNVPQLIRLSLEHRAGRSHNVDGHTNIYETFPVFIQKVSVNEQYQIYANRYVIEKLADGFEVVSGDCGGEYLGVSKTRLDKLYPGLAQRVELLHDLGMELNEISKLALAEYKSSTSALALENITFD